MIHQLKGQLEELESYAYASGEGTMPSNVLLDRQRVVMGKFMLSLSTVEVFWKKTTNKVEKVLKSGLDLIPSSPTLVKIQIMGGKLCFVFKSLLATPSNVLSLQFTPFPPIISIFTEGDGIESRLSS